MFKIGEFSKITQVSIRMLRYYDEQQLLIPCEVDKYTGYRLYSADQIEQLNRIVLLRDMGFGVKEIKNLLAEWNPTNIKENILGQMRKTEENIQLEQRKLQQMKGWLFDLDNPEKPSDIEIILKPLPGMHVVSMRKVVSDYYQESSMWQEFGQVLKDIKNVDKCQSFSIYHDLDYREKDVDIEICVELDPIALPQGREDVICRQVEKVDMAACFMIHGPFSNISPAYQKFAYWLEQHKEYRMQGENRQICHVSMCHTDNPEEYLTELQIPLVLDSHTV